MSVLLILGFVLFVIVAIVATIGSTGSPYERIGESRLPAQPPADGRDPGLVEEVRQLVVARNERRARAGQPPLDVEAEVARTLEELSP
jgi:hypothetical protein